MFISKYLFTVRSFSGRKAIYSSCSRMILAKPFKKVLITDLKTGICTELAEFLLIEKNSNDYSSVTVHAAS